MKEKNDTTRSADRGVAKSVDPTAEDAYWREHYALRDYVKLNRPYADYGPAYRYGWESRVRLGNRPFQEVESELARGWDRAKGESKLVWTHAKHATSDAWHRIVGA